MAAINQPVAAHERILLPLQHLPRWINVLGPTTPTKSKYMSQYLIDKNNILRLILLILM